MYDLFPSTLADEPKNILTAFIQDLQAIGKTYLLRNDILSLFENYQKPAYFYQSSFISRLIHITHEIILKEEGYWFVTRPQIATQEIWRLRTDFSGFEAVTSQQWLNVCDTIVNRYQPHILEIDFQPFESKTVKITDARNIGEGLACLNRYLCDQILSDNDYWLNVLFHALQSLNHNNRPLLIGDRISSGTELVRQTQKALELLHSQPTETPYINFLTNLRQLGFEPGWGNTAGRICESLELLQQLIHTPQPAILETFLTRIPAIFRVVLVSIHGWVGQQDVLGRDETLGQVIYVLEQARSLENKLQREIKQAGLDLLGIEAHIIILTRLIPDCQGTECNLRLEKVDNTQNAWILRVPFREFNPEITNKWIGKSEIWPYLETFAEDAEQEIVKQLSGNPNLIIGNYSDGNLVASLLARRFKITQCNIAHSLEKPKHLFSNLHWQELENRYHFSAQFTADLISMNSADYIITSSYQEIVGTPDTVGQYESYKCFTMPELYHVIDGIDLFSPRFNMIPPGVDENLFYPYCQIQQRDKHLTANLKHLIFHLEHPHILGKLTNPQKYPILTIAPITSIKNLSGLAECFGRSHKLQELCNLIFVTSKLYPDEANNQEEAAEIQTFHDILNFYHLYDKVRCIGMRLPTEEIGEVYRVIADAQGVYVHFARFESFGRSILEAMISGLPTFVTKFGGALEIIEERENGFHVNPTHLEETAAKIINFIHKCGEDAKYWQDISQGMTKRIQDKYNWDIHTSKMLLLAKIFSFWNFALPETKAAKYRYLEALFHLIFKPRAEIILQKHMQR